MGHKVHTFVHSIESIPLPAKFTYPFHYTPHPLCVLAAEETQAYLRERKEWAEELRKGKMFGVLIVRRDNGTIGYLAAFSGNLAGKSQHDFFVPPVYDLSDPEGFFRVEERQISQINQRIEAIQGSPDYRHALQERREASSLAQQTITEAKERLRQAKEHRRLRRQDPSFNEQENALLIRESQYQKAEYKRLERALREGIAEKEAAVERFTTEIERLKQERKSRSAALQHQIFERFSIWNGRGEQKDLLELFAPTPQGEPPAGAGECAAPKLLQYAFQHQLQPVAMAEFWWGESPKTEIRHHGYFYPACQGKCGPILRYMLQGLEVEENLLSINSHANTELKILYEDNAVVVIDKPAGMLSVPGKEEIDSVDQRLRARYPGISGPILVHRLDMATSGLLLAAKSKEAYLHLQKQFEERTVRKRYIALLDGIVEANDGIIRLPLCPDPLDRPRQIVSERYGKPAITRYHVRERSNGKTLIELYPYTGRTHQLRVHAAHPDGLHCPILGDTLYGREAKRLYLHAETLAFRHPSSDEWIEIHSEPPFTIEDE